MSHIKKTRNLPRNTTRNPNKRFNALFVVLGVVFIIFVAIGHHLTGPEFAFSLFYLIPICLVTWFVGKKAGILISVFSAMTWLVTDLAVIHSYYHSFLPYLNETFRLIVFLIVTILLSKLKILLEHEKEFARKDSLTGIPNRRSFFELSTIEINRANRYGGPMTIVYLDVDDFKAVNDRCGHNAGDELLCTVADTIRKNIRSTDTAARLGGDEFAILLRETGRESALKVTHKLRDELINVAKTDGCPVSFSIGVATYNGTTATVDQIVNKADSLMYSAKRSGKNKIVHETFAESDVRVEGFFSQPRSSLSSERQSLKTQ